MFSTHVPSLKSLVGLAVRSNCAEICKGQKERTFTRTVNKSGESLCALTPRSEPPCTLADALEKVYQDLGPNAEDVIFRMAVKERQDEQLEQAHREAGRLGEREDHYVALKSIESYEL